MTHEHEQSAARRIVIAIGVLGLSVLAGAAACTKDTGRVPAKNVTLRVGVGALPQQAPQAGLRQFIGSLSIEPLAATDDNGRLRPLLAENWTTADDGLSVTVHLRHQAKFHDGSTVTGSIVADTLKRALPPVMGSAFDDVERILAVDNSTVRFDLRRRSQFLVEAFETPIAKSGGVGTGPFVAGKSNTSPAVLTANPDYYLERPPISQISVTSYPTVRAAWADLLRGNLDMLNEVNIDALDSLQSASSVALFSYVRHYQYMIVFGSKAAGLRPPEVRRALSAAIDRKAIVQEALSGHGVPSTGPVTPEHWTMSGVPAVERSQQLANMLASRHLKFTCLVPADAVYERVALAVKRQLAAVSVEMDLQEVTQEEIVDALRKGSFDALLGDIVSGPTLFRSFRMWSSHGQALTQKLSSPQIDTALDQINHAANDDEYRAGVRAFGLAMSEEPPALFLAWGERARAISRRFEVPTPEKGRDVLNSIRLWRPATTQASAN